MNSGLIGKVEKAKRYAQERDRARFCEFTVAFRGENDHHTVSFKEGTWRCSCDFFAGNGLCSHTMALERILGEMLPKPVSTPA
jgi:hypothetical protein